MYLKMLLLLLLQLYSLQAKITAEALKKIVFVILTQRTFVALIEVKE